MRDRQGTRCRIVLADLMGVTFWTAMGWTMFAPLVCR